jgi:leucyl-tRNA synthetase
VERFFRQVWRLCTEDPTAPAGGSPASVRDDLALLRGVHRAIRKVTDDLERLAFNTAIAELMSLTNLLREHRGTVSLPAWDEAVRALLLLLAPLAPHLTEELWARKGLPFSIHRQPWLTPDEALLQAEELEIAVQVDGRVRARVTVSTDAPEAEVEAVAVAAVEAHLRGCLVERVIQVPGRLVNIVTAKMT